MELETRVPSWVSTEPVEETQTAEEKDDGVCKMCKKNPSLPESPLPYCQDCRERLINRPIPNLIKGLAVVVGILMLVSAVKVPGAFSNAKAYKEGIRSYQKMEYSEAVQSFEYLTSHYPNSEEFNAWMYLSYVNAGQLDQAEQVYDKVSGEMKDLSDELSEAIDVFNAQGGGE